jgi:hypothetical protein
MVSSVLYAGMTAEKVGGGATGVGLVEPEEVCVGVRSLDPIYLHTERLQSTQHPVDDELFPVIIQVAVQVPDTVPTFDPIEVPDVWTG